MRVRVDAAAVLCSLKDVACVSRSVGYYTFKLCMFLASTTPLAVYGA
jgi:hypothetical protein